MKFNGKIKGEFKNYPNLIDYFKPGERVKRKNIDKKGKLDYYKGIVMNINKNSMEIYWDIHNGRYCPNEIYVQFTNCSLEEIFEGCDGYTPIRNVKFKFLNILKEIY
jgi:hypothetical protein